MKDNLKKGQGFIGIDDEKYYFLGYDYENQIMFTNLDLWTDKEQKYMVKNNLFIKEILDEKSEIIENCAWYYQSIKELTDATTEEQIKRCLDIIDNSNTSEIRLKPTRVESLAGGQAYCKELNQFYEVIGFIVENNIYVDGKLKANERGFFPIYHSNCDDTAPLIFERTNSEKGFVNSNNDKVDIVEIILSKEQVNENITSNLYNRLEKKYNSENEYQK